MGGGLLLSWTCCWIHSPKVQVPPPPSLFPAPCLSIGLHQIHSPQIRSMGSSPRLFGRQRSIHHILGSGFVADVMLWRRRDVTVGILFGTVGAWVLFQLTGYTRLWLASSVLLLLISILFVWAKAATLLNRPPPPIPMLNLSEEIINEAVIFVHTHVNTLLSGFHDIALGKNSNLFYRAAACLWLISIVGSWTDLLTFSCTNLVIVLTVPALYEKYEDNIDRYVMLVYMEMERVYEKCFIKVKQWNLEKKRKLS